MAVRTVRNANVDTDLTTIALSGLDSTAGMVVQTATDTFTKRTLTAANGVSIADGTGAGANPTFSINSAKVQQIVATYAALTALTTDTGLIDSGVYQMLYRTTEGDFGGGAFTYSTDISARAVVSTKTVASVNTGTDVLTVTAHGFDTEDVVIASAADAGLSLNTLYFVRWISANTITLHTSLLGARANTGLVNITALVGSLSLKHLADPGQGVYVIPTGAALDGSGGGFERIRNKGHIYAAWYGLTLGASGAAAANHLAFEYAMMMCEADGGGIVDVFGTGASFIEFNSTINNRHDFVLFRGAGASDVHDVAGSTSLGTTLKCTAAVTAFDHVSPYTGGPRKSGGGFEYLTLITGSHTRALKLDSRRGTTVDITFVGTAGTEGVLVDSGVSFTDLGENADSQRFRKFRVNGLLTTGSADVVVFDGSSNANTSITGNIHIEGTVYDGYALRLRNADHLTVDRLITNIYPGGSGSSFYCHGTNAGAGTYTSGIEILDWGGGGYVEGTEVSGTTVAARITLRGQDIGNSSPAPTLGTGAEVTYYDDYGRAYFQTSLQPSFGNTIAEANSARALQRSSSASLSVFNNSQNHIQFGSTGHTFALRINASNDASIVNVLGGGVFNMPAGSKLAGTALGTASTANTGTSGATVPLLDGTNTFSGRQTLTYYSGVDLALNISATIPGWELNETDASLNNKNWQFYAQAGVLTFTINGDTKSSIANWMTVTRSGFASPAINFGGPVSPLTDNVHNLGGSSFRWGTVYAGTGTINTSDAREKTELAPISDGAMRAMRKIIAGIGVYQWLDAVARKGEDAARLHVGVTAQAVRDAFISEGEDPSRWALFCADAVAEQVDDNGQQLVRLGLRHDQLFALAIAVLFQSEGPAPLLPPVNANLVA